MGRGQGHGWGGREGTRKGKRRGINPRRLVCGSDFYDSAAAGWGGKRGKNKNTIQLGTGRGGGKVKK